MMKVITISLLMMGAMFVPSLLPSVDAPYLAAYADEHDDAREALKRGDILPYSEIKRIVERQVDGKVVGQRLHRTNRGWQYDLRLRPPNGRVMVLVVNAKNGNIISKRQ